MSGFFDGIEQTPVRIGDAILQTPAFYHDAAATMGLFPARMGAVRALLADRTLRPARLLPGVTLVGVVGYRYRDTPVGPYDEVGILIPLAEGSNFPLRALASAQLTGRSHWYVHWLPVDREAASHGGDVWGFQSAVADISLTDHDGEHVWRLADDDGLILELRCARVKTRERPAVLTSFMHARLDGQAQRSEVRVNAIEQGTSARFGAARLVLGDAHPRARELAGLLLSTRSIAMSALPRSQSILFPPDRLTPAVLRRLGLVGAPAEHGTQEVANGARGRRAVGAAVGDEDRRVE